MATDKPSQSRKRKIPKSDDFRAKRAKENQDTNTSQPIIEWEQELVAGKVKRMFLKNFMCHDALEVEFNQKVNFIVGANGSGKSAILTALIVGLGAKAKYANRGPQAKEFIKKGKNSASVEITVSNEGPMAYQYEVFGDSITVLRTIPTSGVSSYKIKNWRGDVVTTKKRDLDKIVACLNIQVDNPISVLNQDVSRSFLVTAGPKEKYELMMRATRLEAINKNYKDASIACEESRKKLKDALQILMDDEKELKKLEKKVKALESLDSVRSEYESVQKELPWAEVIIEEKSLLKIEGKIKDQEKKIENLKEQELSKAAKEEEIDKKIEELKKEIIEAEKESVDSNAKLVQIKNKFTEKKKIHEENKEKVRSHHQSIKIKENDIIELQNEISKMEKELAESDKKQAAKEELTKREQELNTVEASYKTKKTDLMHLEENNRRIEEEEKNLRFTIDRKKSDLNQQKTRLTSLQNQSNDAFSVYGPNMSRLLRRIQEEYQRGKFKQMPVGPLGAHIKMKDSSWIPAVENQLGLNFLSSFCVDNINDNRVFSIIVKEVFRGERAPQVTISKFFNRVHDTRDGCTRCSRYSNLLDAMEIDHPVVANCLIDQREIECNLLIPSSEEACHLMSEQIRVPPNCRKAFTKNADLFFPDPNYKTYGGQVHRPKFLQVSTSEAIQLLHEEIATNENELKLVQQQYQEVRERMGKTKAELCQVNDSVKRLTKQQQQLKKRIEELKEILETSPNNTLNTFLQELEELKKQVADKKEVESKLMEKVRNSAKELEEVNEEYRTCRNLATNLDKKLNPIKEKIKDLKDEKNRLGISNQGATRRFEEAKKLLKQLQDEHMQQERIVTSKVVTAEETGERIETKRSVADITTRLRELKLTIEHVEKQHGNLNELLIEMTNKKEKFEDLQRNTIRLQKNNDKQIERLRKRKTFFNQMKKEISERVQHAFVNILKLRNYRGSLQIDHNNKELLLDVTPSTEAKRSHNDAKALSGGERSYSTVAFILALWETIALPFYFLDEFDVFMDKINRRTVMDILLSHALSHPECQFGFLTPLDTSHIVADNNIKIHRLAAPERSA